MHDRIQAKAKEIYYRITKDDPDNEIAYIQLCTLLWQNSEYRNIENILRKAIDKNPENDKYYGLLALLSNEIGQNKQTKEYFKKSNYLRLMYESKTLGKNYLKLKKITDEKRIQLVCMQYPIRSIDPLKALFSSNDDIIFISNEYIFKNKLKESSYNEYFTDIFAGDFGHCTCKGNKLIAENITNVLMKRIFKTN